MEEDHYTVIHDEARGEEVKQTPWVKKMTCLTSSLAEKDG